MAELRLSDFVLLQSSFEMWPGDVVLENEEDEEVFGYPEGDFLKLEAKSAREDNDFVLYLTAALKDEKLPFELRVLVGARFSVEGEGLDLPEVEPTLTWLCYPYVRELIASITGRSPLPAYYLPALTKMPHPRVLGETEPVAASE